MEAKKRFFECYVPCSICNLRCEYCYVIQQNRRKGINSPLRYPVETLLAGLSRDRLGGTCFFSICAVGETLIPDYIIPLIRGLLAEGHVVNVTNNGTMSRKISELCCLDPKLLKRLHFSFSFHYKELKEKGLLDVFFQNVLAAKQAGCSFIVKLNLCDSYIDEIETIKEICREKVGALPVVSITRKQEKDGFSLYTQDERKYISVGRSFHSSMFDFTLNFYKKKRREFCYAGDWSALLNLQTGVMTKCYANSEGGVDIFEDISKPIMFEAVGKHCHNGFCVNADHFISQGVIPSIPSPGYADLRTDHSRDWYSPEMKKFLNQKLSTTNRKYGLLRKARLSWLYRKRVWKTKVASVLDRLHKRK